MYRKIFVPVDLQNVDKLQRALKVAADLSKLYDIDVVYVGVTPETPSEVAHSPVEFAGKLDQFCRREVETHGHRATAKAYASHDPSVDLDDTLLKAIDEAGADLVVIAGFEPSLADHLRRSHEGSLAGRSKASVFIVR